MASGRHSDYYFDCRVTALHAEGAWLIGNLFFEMIKGMIDADVAAATDAYPHITRPDPNIDFRRVRTLYAFFSRHAESLTTALDDPAQWQAGDIVIFGENEHVGVCSDLRDRNGIPLLLHHGNPVDEAVERIEIPHKTVTAHFRWPG